MLESQSFCDEDGEEEVQCISSSGYHNLGDYDGI